MGSDSEVQFGLTKMVQTAPSFREAYDGVEEVLGQVNLKSEIEDLMNSNRVTRTEVQIPTSRDTIS